MNSAIPQIGSEIADPLRILSGQSVIVPIKTTGDLLAILGKKPSRSFPMLKSTCGLLGTYLDLPGDEIPFDTLDDRRKGFRKFLDSRRYADNSVRTYVNQLALLLKTARKHGWKPDQSAPEDWKPLLKLAAEKRVLEIARHFSRITHSPADVTPEDMDEWYKSRLQEGFVFTTSAEKRNAFWRLLQEAGWTKYMPPYLIKQNKYGIPLDKLAPTLRDEIEIVLKWKQADFARNRPKWGKIRAITAEGLRLTLCQIAGYATNVYGAQPASLIDLIQKDIIEGFVEWAINERKKKGINIQSRLGMVAAIVLHHPTYAKHDFNWFKLLIDSIPLEDESERRARKAEKYIEYDVLATIPEKMRAERLAYAKKTKNIQRLAKIAMEELMVRWLLVLPWRQRNLRECRIDGSSPNLFKAKIPPLNDLDLPAWVVAEQEQNPNTEFWQVRFSSKETKTGISVHILLPRQLIQPLEEYLADYRPRLLGNRKTELLLLNESGGQMYSNLFGTTIGHWSLQFTGARTTPHLFRDSVAHKWLKSHPKDFLTLSKMLWHKNIQTTIRIYGARYNESSGVCAMEAWLDQREANAE